MLPFYLIHPVLWTSLAAGLKADLVAEEWKGGFKRQTVLFGNGESDHALKGYLFILIFSYSYSYSCSVYFKHKRVIRCTNSG